MPTFDITAPDGKSYEIEGATAEGALAALKKHLGSTPATPSVDVADIFKSASVGLGKGAIGLGGFIGDMSDLGAKGLEYATNYVSDKLGVERYRPSMDRSQSVLNNIPTSASLTKNVEGVTGEFYKPQTTAGQYAQTVGEFLPSAAIGPGGAAARIGSAVGGGLASEALGQATAGTAAEPYARVIGGVAGGLGPSLAARAVTPMPSTPARQRLVDILADEGVTSLTAGQRTGNKALQYAESILGDGPLAGQGATRIQQEGQRQFTEAAMRRAGAGPDAVPEVLAANQLRLGRQFDDLSARNTMVPDRQFANDLGTTMNRYDRLLETQQRPIVNNIVDDIVTRIGQNGGVLSGIEYQTIRSDLSRAASETSNPTLGGAFRGIRNALDDAMGRSISPADREAWQTVRREYGAQEVLKKTASRAGEATAEGQIVPANLRNTVAAENRGAYALGEGQFSELSRAGAGVMAPLPNSGTAQRSGISDMAKNLMMAIPSVTAGRALMSAPVQRYLSNQLVPQAANMTPGSIALARALLAQDRTGLQRVYVNEP
jgi:hypothetical protein